ncbi:MAG: hypothetical protein ABJH99_19270, partial [Tateyamaria sp.]
FIDDFINIGVPPEIDDTPDDPTVNVVLAGDDAPDLGQTDGHDHIWYTSTQLLDTQLDLEDSTQTLGFGDDVYFDSDLGNNAGGNAGRDIFVMLGGDDEIQGDDKADFALFGTGDDRGEGNRGNDMMWGEDGNDTLAGGDGDDSLFGGIGDDVLNGLGGDDMLNGAAGADTFVFSGSDFGNDTIDNFAISAASAEHDVLVFVANTGEVADFAAFVAAADQVGSDIVYDLGDDSLNAITIRNTFLANMTADDFDFL